MKILPFELKSPALSTHQKFVYYVRIALGYSLLLFKKAELKEEETSV
jgi:hypothetical protein